MSDRRSTVKQGQILLYDWIDHQYAVLDLESGEMQPVDPLIEGSTLLWRQEGTAMIELHNQLYRVELETGAVETLGGWEQVAFCR